MSASDELNRTILLCRDYVDDRVSDDEICSRLRSTRILCVSDANNVSTHGGQTALITLVLLALRMGSQVTLAIPDSELLGPQPPLSGTSLKTALTGLSDLVIAGATVGDAPDQPTDAQFLLGNSEPKQHGVPTWRLTGGDWWGALNSAADPTDYWKSEWPVGSMVSGALAAAETFKMTMSQLQRRQQSDRIFLEPSIRCKWDFGALQLPRTPINLGDVDVISAGAISQAALYAAMRFPRLTMSGRIFDHDITEATNLNRNMLTMRSDVGLPKVHVVTSRCGAKLRVEPIATRYEGETVQVTQLASRVLIGVDDIPSRWEVQRRQKQWLAVGGTTHFNASSSEHGPGEPCAGCLHPVDDPQQAGPIPTVSFVSFWAGLAMAVRVVRVALSASYGLARQHLWLSPIRMDQRRAGIWSPVAPIASCPISCRASRWAFASKS